MKTVASTWLAVLVLSLVTLQAAAETTSEAAFRAAKAWTVRVQVEMPTPFIEDQKGSYEGAGFVVDAKRGWILTNAHVAGHSPTILRIAFDDGRLIQAERVYVDPYLDVAVIAYKPEQLKEVPPEPTLECNSVPPVGHPVGAYGHPWGFRFTGTRGIASAVTPRFGADMLQTDAPINAGNSGGPLISLETGHVVGISTAKIADEEVEGLSFAVPMPFVCTILTLLKAGQDPSPPAAGVEFAIDENDERTLVVANTRLETPGIDLRPEDEIVAVAGRVVTTPTQFVDAVRSHLDDLVLTVRRDGRETRVTGKIPAAPRIIERRGLWVDGALFAPGADFYGGILSDGEGIMVHHIEEASEAQSVGLAVYDAIERVNGRSVHSLEELERIIVEAIHKKRPIELLIIRFGNDPDRLFQYQRRYLSGENVSWVGGPPQ